MTPCILKYFFLYATCIVSKDGYKETFLILISFILKYILLYSSILQILDKISVWNYRGDVEVFKRVQWKEVGTRLMNSLVINVYIIF